MSGLTTHVLDTSRGRPAGGVPLKLEYSSHGDTWEQVSTASTNADGRAPTLLPDGLSLQPGFYRLTFDTSAYFKDSNMEGFYPYVAVVFQIKDPSQHYHVPLLLSPFGYSTYRGS